jgi:hypothetical protein
LLSYDWKRYPVNRDFEPQDIASGQSMTMSCADWLMKNIKLRGSFAVWTYPYPMSYGTNPGWCSAHAQAVGLQLLARVAKLTKDEKYLEPVASLLAAFEIEVANGGLVHRDESYWWFEKFADPENAKPKVLNGAMFALLGLAEVAGLLSCELAKSLFERGLAAVLAFLPNFDLGDWSA